MKITILPQGTLAIYEQIVNQLKNAVVTGELKAGEALPSIRALAADLGVSVITTKRAYEELEKEGLVRSVAGKGFYVCEYNADYLKEKQLVLLEKRLNEVIEEAKQAGFAKEDFVEKQYAELGKAYYEKHKDEENAKTEEKTPEQEHFFLITEALGEIERMRAEVFKLQGATECPKCGAKMPQGAAFCSNCGTKMDDMFEE